MLNLSRLSLGMVETVGLAAAIEAADVAVKSANVKLIGYELTKGGGMVTIKIAGDVGAVKAAVDAARIAASKISTVFSHRVIARPHEEIEKLIRTTETVGVKKKKKDKKDKEDISNKEDLEEREEILEEIIEEKTDTITDGETDIASEEIEQAKVTEEVEIEEIKTEEIKTEEVSQTEIEETDEAEEIQEITDIEVLTEDTTDDEKKNDEIGINLETNNEDEIKEEKTPEEVCNFCKDPKCPRKKGELRNTCIHYDELLDQ